MELLAQTRIVTWEGASLWLIDATPTAGRQQKQTDLHAHHAIQVTISLGARFSLRTADHQIDGGAAAVAADVPHLFAAEGRLAMLFVEPESRAGRAIAARLFGEGSLAPVPDELLAAFRRDVQSARPASIADLGRTLVETLAAERAPGPDARVLKLIAAARARLDEPVSLADFVGVGGISAGRLRHLSVEQTGLPFRTYLLWLRLTRAMEEIVAGASLTGAAHQAGFADSAHLSRTFRRMFGIAPTALQIS